MQTLEYYSCVSRNELSNNEKKWRKLQYISGKAMCFMTPSTWQSRKDKIAEIVVY